MAEKNTKKVMITDTILRDAHQSQAATRMRTDEMIPVLEQLDEIGYYSLEAWGGATFDSCLRFLNEDPWERLRTLKKYLKKTPIQMLLRGQNLLGYRHYSDDVVEKFVAKSIENGVGIVRVFDALNDPRNLETSMKAIKKYGGVCEAAISYTTCSIVIFFRDLQQIVNIFLQVGMWATPVLWNINQFGEEIQMLVKINPLVYIVEGYRSAVYGKQWFWEDFYSTVYFWIITIVLFGIGALIFKKLKIHFADIM